MTEWEKSLPPIARERLARIGEPTREEKDSIRDAEVVDSLLAEFYQGQIAPDELWKRLKEEGKPSLLRKAQMRLLDSLSFGSAPADLHSKSEGIIAIETLKEDQNTPLVERILDLIEHMQERYGTEAEEARSKMRAEVERNPQLRMKQVQQGQSTIMIQLTVDEAIEELPQWRDFLAEHGKRYSREFNDLVEKLRSGLA